MALNTALDLSIAGLSGKPDESPILTPRKFIASFGVPYPRLLAVPQATISKISPHPDRYLLVFWKTDADILIAPDFDSTFSTSAFSWTTTAQPLIISHGSHGAWVNLGWRLQRSAAGADAQVTIVEGFMTNPKVRRKGW